MPQLLPFLMIEPSSNYWNPTKAELLNLHWTLPSQLQPYLQYILTFCYQVTHKVCFPLQLQSCLPVGYQSLLIKAIFESFNIEQFRNNLIIYTKQTQFCCPSACFTNRRYSIYLKTIYPDPFLPGYRFHFAYIPLTSGINRPRTATPTSLWCQMWPNSHQVTTELKPENAADWHDCKTKGFTC